MVFFRKEPGEINDGIDRAFVYPPYVFELLDTAEAERLHSIVQNGFSSYSYPNLTHTRKSHSIGTARNAILMWRSAAKTGPERFDGEAISRYEAIIASAALLHDIGHSPFSHDLEAIIKHFTQKSHETVAAEMITGEFSLRQFYETLPKGILSDAHRSAKLAVFKKIPSIPEVLRHYVIPEETVAQIVDKKRAKKKDGACNIPQNHFLREIVDHTVVDADKLDYLVRDSHNAGITETHFSPEGIIANLGLVKAPDGVHLAVSDMGIEMVNQLLTTRAYMYSRIYTHKTVLKVQAMVYDACKRLLASLGDKAKDYGGSLYLFDDQEFEAFIASHSDLNPVAARLFMTALYDRRNKYSFAYSIENRELPIAVDGAANEKTALFEKLLGLRGSLDQDIIRDEILERANAKHRDRLEDHEIIVYFPLQPETPKMSSLQEQYGRFNLFVFEHRNPEEVYLAGKRLQEGFYDERLTNAFRAFCRHQKSNYFLVLCPKQHLERVKKATEEYVAQVMK